MGLTVWLCVLCLQAGLLSHALDCSGPSAGEDCVRKQITGGQADDLNPQRSSSPLSPFRHKRHVERRGPTHLSQFSLPGAFSAKGFPNTLIQAERARRHLPQSSNKKKNKRKSRVGSFSLLSNDKSTPLQVVRARRQVKSQPPKKGQHAGAYSILGDSQNDGQNDRPKRSTRRGGTQRRRPIKKDVC